MKKILVFILIFISFNFIYADNLRYPNQNSQWAWEYDLKNKNKYLNMDNFSKEFKSIYGDRTGADVGLLIDDIDFQNGHGKDMYIASNLVKISDDIKYILVDEHNILIPMRFEEQLKYILNTYKDKNPRVYSYSLTIDIKDKVENFLNTLKQNDIIFVFAAGNTEKIPEDTKYLDNLGYDNVYVVAELGERGIINGNYPQSDFSVFAGFFFDYDENSAGISGTSSAAAVTSTILAQYYAIRPCWSYKDMNAFIYATLKPTSELGITDDRTKTKKYLAYDTRIFDDNFVTQLGLPICSGLGTIDNITK